MFELLDELNNIISENLCKEFNKIELIIKSNKLFAELDEDEKEIIIEDASEKYQKLSEKKNLDDIKFFYSNTRMKKNKYSDNSAIFIKNDYKLLTEGEIMSSIKYAIMIKEPSKEEIIKRTNIFNETKILSANMPVQKSEEWHIARRMRCGGSDSGCILNMNKHQAQYTFILDKVLGAEFKGNAATYHGNVFEDVVRMMYEYNNDVHTEEFSSMPHKTNPILAASPDGIVSPYCRDMKSLTPLVGRMLEIKCPTMRKIQYKGNIKDTICPIYYWCQIQQQLECLDLDECDFIQCNIERYKNRQEWLLDTHDKYDFKSKKYGNPRGIIIEIIPLKLEPSDYNENGQFIDMTIWTKTKCLFPPKIDMSLKELDDWVLLELENIPYNYKLHKIIYWRLIEQNCTLILRDKVWFESQLPIYNKIWNYVIYLRENLDVIIKWKEWINKLQRKYNDKIIEKLDMLIEEKENLKLINKKETIETIEIYDDCENNNLTNNLNQDEKIKRKYNKKQK